MSVEREYGLPGGERHSVRHDGNLLHVTGTLTGRNGCAAVAYGGARTAPRTHGGAVVDLTRVEDGQVCTMAMTSVNYDLTLAFDQKPPSNVDVRLTDGAIERPLVRSASFDARDDAGSEHHEVERDPALDRATVSGTVLAGDACTGYQYAGTERRGDGTTVVLESTRPEGVLCAQVVTPIDYELELEFPRDLPANVDVEVR